MRNAILAVLMAIPLMGMAAPKAPSMRLTAQEHVKQELQTPTKFGLFAQHNFTASGHNLIVTCGTVNAINTRDGYHGDNFYFNTYFKTDGRPRYISTEFFSIEDVEIQALTISQMPEDDTRREVMKGFYDCIYKLK